MTHSCKWCRGSGIIPLFNSTVKCECGAIPLIFKIKQWILQFIQDEPVYDPKENLCCRCSCELMSPHLEYCDNCWEIEHDFG